MKKMPLTVYKRDTTRKSELKKLRTNSLVPGIIYGEGLNENLPISIFKKDLIKLLKLKREEDFLVEIEVNEDKSKYVALIKDEQYHPVTDDIIHIDFHSVSLEKEIVAKIPIHFVGEPKGVKEGGVLYKALHELEIEAKPLDLPSFIEVYISELEIGDSIHIEDLKIPPNVKILHEPFETVVSVTTVEEEVEVAKPEEVEAPETQISTQTPEKKQEEPEKGAKEKK
ncbi:MAG: 50S ribosomal protein L25 [Caldisericia bacterium]|nr:50S ribosomal protein L25 [Caldisericia bacterium]